MIRIREGRLEVPNTVNLDGSAVVRNSHQLLYPREPFPSLKPEPNEGCTRTRNLVGRFDRLHAREPVTHYYVGIGLAPACTPSSYTISIAYGNSTLSMSVLLHSIVPALLVLRDRVRPNILWYELIPACTPSCCMISYTVRNCCTNAYTREVLYAHRPGIHVTSEASSPHNVYAVPGHNS